MRYLPHTEDDVRRMLDAIGAESLEALFALAAAPEAVEELDPVHVAGGDLVELALHAGLDVMALRRQCPKLHTRDRAEGRTSGLEGALEHATVDLAPAIPAPLIVILALAAGFLI